MMAKRCRGRPDERAGEGWSSKEGRRLSDTTNEAQLSVRLLRILLHRGARSQGAILDSRYRFPVCNPP